MIPSDVSQYGSENLINNLYEDNNDGDIIEEDGVSFTEYDISASPNDFNVRTLYDFLDSGVVRIPGFQRSYVWDIKRASKLIESLLVGLPIPQIFLYEEAKNRFLVIDGQQRYFTIYFFKSRRFPRKEKRFELRRIFEESRGGFPAHILSDNNYFVDFNLQLPPQLPGVNNRFNGLNYLTLLDDDRTAFDLRTIRNVIIKQNAPDDGASAVFEIFNRLNSGGINLKPQEIRTSLYHSPFYDMLYRLNMNTYWRQMTPDSTPDLNMKDVEILLRGFAMLTGYSNYSPSLNKFLNKFSATAKTFSVEKILFLENLFNSFIENIRSIDNRAFFNRSGRFNISFYESIFVALCETSYTNGVVEIKHTTLENINTLKQDPLFIEATQIRTSSTANVTNRINRAREIL